jgi:hypothetical protein
MPTEYFDWMTGDIRNRRVYRVCQSCGAVYEQFLDNYENGYALCGNSPKNMEIAPASDVRVIFNTGIPVPMMSGCFASYHTSANIWLDDGFDDAHVEATKKLHSTVDTKNLIRIVKNEYPENYENVLRSISAYISGIDWRGTPYEHC